MPFPDSHRHLPPTPHHHQFEQDSSAINPGSGGYRPHGLGIPSFKRGPIILPFLRVVLKTEGSNACRVLQNTVREHALHQRGLFLTS